jgi:hypothetical protein
MTTKKTIEEPEVAPGAPMSFRDFVGEVPPSDPVEIAYPQEPVSEPAKPATKKEN